MLEKLNFYINLEKITEFKRQNNVSLSTQNQRPNLTLEQRWFLGVHKNIFVLMLNAWEIVILILTLKR